MLLRFAFGRGVGSALARSRLALRSALVSSSQPPQQFSAAFSTAGGAGGAVAHVARPPERRKLVELLELSAARSKDSDNRLVGHRDQAALRGGHLVVLRLPAVHSPRGTHDGRGLRILPGVGGVDRSVVRRPCCGDRWSKASE